LFKSTISKMGDGEPQILHVLRCVWSRDKGGRLESFVAMARSIARTETGDPARLLRLRKRFVSSEFLAN
jgi:hypothetical protein